ncbi:MAG: hypothetical protein ACE5G6_01090 [Terriglobia bacterium]
MKKTRILALALALGLALAVGTGIALAGDPAGPQTIQGTLVDSKCFSMAPSKNAGNDHMTPKGTMKNCGTACANMGVPVNLLTAEGKVFTLAVPASAVASYVGQEARATGMLHQRTLVVKKLAVKEGTTWREVKIATMM